ncbi:uncharacterized protein BDCG_06513 [Blastomyces dermatitidis ER-3]|uniref:DUF7770 domain-containing protein n=1 Tax=Ajellomyces dermatitidis (strain ER-3 / ATCC MYA-2586) TaxID=559297 RepID=A0ABP2F3D2_AJEDR|nr:uncharacterized protein BDCG_06513 [Blastomyces dermatitidis ER-3]EEQ91393.1 hypothetical protein BDCG_06513 [Blastomyces dermatitidis ER-3]
MEPVPQPLMPPFPFSIVLNEDTPIKSVRVAVDLEAYSPDTLGNNWSIYLLHRDVPSSVRINMHAEPGQMNRILRYQKYDHFCSPALEFRDFEITPINPVTVSYIAAINPVTVADIATIDPYTTAAIADAKPVTVAHIAKLLEYEGRGEYQIPSGWDTRPWVYTMVYDLVNHHYISSDALRSVSDILQYWYVAPDVRVYSHISLEVLARLKRCESEEHAINAVARPPRPYLWPGREEMG